MRYATLTDIHAIKSFGGTKVRKKKKPKFGSNESVRYSPTTVSGILRYLENITRNNYYANYVNITIFY